ncbi:MAG: PilZ domain-containing protein [Clostridiales bacterium]|nr:PilZ domain-containing protein [Clostridiales bacterium]
MVRDLKRGSKISIAFEKNHKKSYTTYVETAYENQLLVYNPIKDNKLVNLPNDKDMLYMVQVYTERGILTYHNVSIKRKFHKDNYHFVLLENLGNIIHEQRREFYRLDCMVPFLVKDKNEETYQAIIKDISEGGLLFVSNLEMFPAEERECSVSFNNQRISIIIKILDKKGHTKPGCKFEYRARLLFVSDEDKSVLLNFILDAQRNYIRKNQVELAFEE